MDVLYFGVLREMMGGARVPMELDEGWSVGDLVARVRKEKGGAVWGSIAVAVNREYAGLSTVLCDGDEVALLPPVSGGGGARVIA